MAADRPQNVLNLSAIARALRFSLVKFVALGAITLGLSDSLFGLATRFQKIEASVVSVTCLAFSDHLFL